MSTQWNSKLIMLKSLLEQYEIVESLLESGGNTLMKDVNKAAMKEVIDFLEPFREATDKLEQKWPTLSLVVLYYTRLAKHLTPALEDTSTIVKMKQKIMQFLGVT